MIKTNSSVLVLALVIAVGTIIFVQQNATNQTSGNYSNLVNAAPDTTKFCADTLNDEGPNSICTSTYKSQGECKKEGAALHGPDFAGCHKSDKTPSNDELSGDADEDADGSGPEEEPEVPQTPPEPPEPIVPADESN